MPIIITAKLIDGTEIIGNLISETEETIRVLQPLQIIYKYSIDSHIPNVTFTKFMMFADLEEFDFQKADFMMIAKAVPELSMIHAKMASDLYKARSQHLPISEASSKEDLYKRILQALEPDDMTEH